VCVQSTSGHVTVLDGGCVKLREWLAEGVGCECFYRFITKVGGYGFPTPLVWNFFGNVSTS
jgi:hypothetical protein